MKFYISVSLDALVFPYWVSRAFSARREVGAIKFLDLMYSICKRSRAPWRCKGFRGARASDENC